jgi:biotin carboxyl carrier protein
MGVAKVVSMTMRPSQVSHLCFEVGGILGTLNTPPGNQTLLGQQVTLFDFNKLYGALQSNSGPSGPSRLFYGPNEIQNYIAANALASLRAEGAKTALRKAINARENAYFAKYGKAQSEAIIKQMNQYYSQTQPDSKPYRLTQLQQLAENQVGALQAAYNLDPTRKLTSPLKGVVKTTISELNSTATGQSNEETRAAIGYSSGNIPPNPPSGGQEFPLDAISFSANSENFDFDEGTSQVKTNQKITNTDYGYRFPYNECQAQYQRAQISLMDQQFAQFMYSVTFNTNISPNALDNLKQVFENELANIDYDVFRLQLAYANTMLMSPISGTVTGIYKNPGDAVRAGEPVIRVENNDTIFLVATLIYPDPIAINSSVTVEYTAFDVPLALSLPGTVVAARGQGQEDQWAVIVQCSNNNAFSKLLPPGYNFDYDQTTVTIN